MFSACLAWSIIGLLLVLVPVLTVVALIVTAILCLPCLLVRQIPAWMPEESSREQLVEMENRLRGKRFSRVKSLDLQLPSGILAHLTEVEQPAEADEALPVLLFVHGICTDSLKCFGNSIAEVEAAARHRAIFVDLPGMGHTPPSDDLRYADAAKTLDIYCNFLKEVIGELQLTKVVLIGHSFGGFISQHFAHRHPELLHTVVLSCPAGVFPSSGRAGIYWAFMFMKIIPCRICDKFGRCGIWLYHKLLSLCRPPSTYQHLYLAESPEEQTEYDLEYYAMRYQLLTAPDRITIIKKFGIFNCCDVTWTHASLEVLLSIKVPMAFIYTTRDDIIPAHQGVLISCLIGAPVPFYILPSWHEPGKEVPKLYLQTILRGVEEACLPHTDPASLTLPVPGSPEWPRVTFDCCLADDVTFDLFYQDLLDLHMRNSYQKAGDEGEVQGGIILELQESSGQEPECVVNSSEFHKMQQAHFELRRAPTQHSQQVDGSNSVNSQTQVVVTVL